MYDYLENREKHKLVKQWAKDAGYPIPGNFKITRAMVDAYNLANDEAVEYYASAPYYPKSTPKAKRKGSKRKPKPDFFLGVKPPARPAPVERTSGIAKRNKYLR